ncbi:MAG: hypothetical protein NT029_10025 [Armatimonadetes bacterium]|nr:hypothetical protein [Armatimonadota bacterium]
MLTRLKRIADRIWSVYSGVICLEWADGLERIRPGLSDTVIIGALAAILCYGAKYQLDSRLALIDHRHGNGIVSWQQRVVYGCLLLGAALALVVGTAIAHRRGITRLWTSARKPSQRTGG